MTIDEIIIKWCERVKEHAKNKGFSYAKHWLASEPALKKYSELFFRWETETRHHCNPSVEAYLHIEQYITGIDMGFDQ